MGFTKKQGKVSNTKILTLKTKIETNNLGILKTSVVALFILLQTALLILSYTYLLSGFKYYSLFSFFLSIALSIKILSSKSNGHTKAIWIIFVMSCYTFGYIFYFFSDEKLLFGRSKNKYKQIISKTNNLITSSPSTEFQDVEIKTICNYLKNSNFCIYNNSKTKYFSCGSDFFDDIIEKLKQAKHFIFIEFYIISNGVLLNRISDILVQKSNEGVDVRIIYDDMGSHSKLKRKTKKYFKKNNIKIQPFNPLVPIFNLALNIRNHRKIVVIDGIYSYTGGINLSDEYVNERQIYGYWKDSGIMIKGPATDNFTLSFLRQWEYLTKESIDYNIFLNKAEPYETNFIAAPFVSGLEYNNSVAKDMYINMIANADEKLYFMTPYFIPDESIINLLINKANSGVDVRLIIPHIADKRTVYLVTTDYAERLVSYGVKVYTMTNSFVHSKLILNEKSAIVGSINIDYRSFYQQFESAVFTNDEQVLTDINLDFNSTIENSIQITKDNIKSNKFWHKVLASIFRLLSPLM